MGPCWIFCGHLTSAYHCWNVCSLLVYLDQIPFHFSFAAQLLNRKYQRKKDNKEIIRNTRPITFFFLCLAKIGMRCIYTDYTTKTTTQYRMPMRIVMGFTSKCADIDALKMLRRIVELNITHIQKRNEEDKNEIKMANTNIW